MRGILLSCFFLFYGVFEAQKVKYLRDRASTAQAKRQVFLKWGEWRPFGNDLLFGMNANAAYARVWGWWAAPKENVRYKNGQDIRPLGPTGIETQRQILLHQQKAEAKKIHKHMNEIDERAKADFAHYTPLTTQTDPLYLLYYRRFMNVIRNFPDTPKNYREWGIRDDETYQMLKSIGKIEDLQERLDHIKHQVNLGLNAGMPRGKRYLLFHRSLLDWRKLMTDLSLYGEQTTMLIRIKKDYDRVKNILSLSSKKKTDTEIIQEQMIDLNHRLEVE